MIFLITFGVIKPFFIKEEWEKNRKVVFLMDLSLCIYIYIYIYVCVEMVDCGEYDKKIKISGKMDKSDTYKGFCSSDISFFIPRISSD